MRSKIALLITMLVLNAAAAVAADYWPMQDGLLWRYGTGASTDYMFGMTCAGGECARGYQRDDGGFLWAAFLTNADGDIEVRMTDFWSGGGFDPDIPIEFDPPLLFLDLPLEVGKQWLSFGNARGIVGRVTGAQVITVPLGTFK